LSADAKDKSISRIIDANANRLKEGLRVCEEVARFILENRRLTEELKTIRHRIDAIIKKKFSKYELLSQRDSSSDIGRIIYGKELIRNSLADIFFANLQRCKESLRVLEEFSKLKDKASARSFKNLRYAIYEVEKKSAKTIANLSDCR